MKLSEEIKNKIYEEYNSFKTKLYAKKSLEERKELDQFFTPPEITIQMIEKMDCDDLSNVEILDPCCGSGNLLVACLIAGAKLDNLYGNEYDKRMVLACRNRLRDYIHRPENAEILAEIKDEKNKYSLHIHRGNALQKLCVTEFNDNYNSNYNPDYIDDLKYAQGNFKTRFGINWDTENQVAYDRAHPPVMATLFD